MAVSRTALRTLLSMPWRRIWAQGGMIRRYDCLPPGVYSDVVVIEVESGLFEIAAVPVCRTDSTEDYEIAVNLLDVVGTAEAERLFAPARRVVHRFPSDLAFDAFVGTTGGVAYVVSESSGECAGRIEKGIVFERANRRLLFMTDIDIPESVVITSSPRQIERLLRGLTVKGI